MLRILLFEPRQHPNQHTILTDMVVPKRCGGVHERQYQNGLSEKFVDFLECSRRASADDGIERVGNLKQSEIDRAASRKRVYQSGQRQRDHRRVQHQVHPLADIFSHGRIVSGMGGAGWIKRHIKRRKISAKATVPAGS